MFFSKFEELKSSTYKNRVFRDLRHDIPESLEGLVDQLHPVSLLGVGRPPSVLAHRVTVRVFADAAGLADLVAVARRPGTFGSLQFGLQSFLDGLGTKAFRLGRYLDRFDNRFSHFMFFNLLKQEMV